MPKTNEDRVIALAGLFQAGHLVQRIAHQGIVDQQGQAVCLASVLKTEAASSADIYDGIAHLQTGLQVLCEHLRNPHNAEMTRYLLAAMILENRLAHQPDILQRIRDGIEVIKARLAYFPITHENIVAALAELYSQTISQLKPRIMVSGQREYLTNPAHVNCIRALLLAAIRAAVLWKQNGGSRWSLLLRRRTLLRTAEQLLLEVEQAAL